MAKRTYRELSQTNWTSEQDTIDRINAGSLQRIADASEKTAAGFDGVLQRLSKAEEDRDLYRKWYYEEKGKVESRDRIIANLRGQITKLKKKLPA